MRLSAGIAIIGLNTLLLALPKDFALNRCVDDPNRLSPKQRAVLLSSYEYGKVHNLGYTLAAIAWKESCAGEYRMNFQDPSAGIYHAYLPGLLKKYPSLQQNGFTQNMLGTLLVRDDAFAAKEAIRELKYWEKIHKGNWAKMIKSYNKGFSWQQNKGANKLAESYYRDIKLRVQKLQSYLPKARLERDFASKQASMPNRPKTPVVPAIPSAIPPSQGDISAPFLLDRPPYGMTRVRVHGKEKAGEFDLLPDR